MEDSENVAQADDKTTQQELETQVEDFLKAWFGVRQQVQGLNFNRAHQHGLSTTQFIVLGFLEEASSAEPATISALANRINLDPATIVRTVDSLEKRGLVMRRRDKQDRRKVFVEFSEEGRATQQQSHLQFKNSILRLFQEMSVAGRLALVKGLEEFVAIGQRHEKELTKPTES